MPKKIIYNGREFEFPDTATDEQIANALKEMFPTTDGGVKKKRTFSNVCWGWLKGLFSQRSRKPDNS